MPAQQTLTTTCEASAASPHLPGGTRGSGRSPGLCLMLEPQLGASERQGESGLENARVRVRRTQGQVVTVPRTSTSPICGAVASTLWGLARVGGMLRVAWPM